MSHILNFNNWTKLNESLLLEGTDLSKDANLKKAFQSIKAQIDKGVKQPSALMGMYLLKFAEPKNFDTALQVDGKVLAFQSMPWKGIGNLPCLPDYTVGFGGTFQWKLSEPVPYAIEMDYTIPQFSNLTTQQVTDTLNQVMSTIPVDTLKAMYNAHPNKAKYDAAIATFKASEVGKKVLAGLTGSAKAFYGV
jgi:hypothetical protein